VRGGAVSAETYALAHQHIALAESITKSHHTTASGMPPEAVMASLGVTLQLLNQTGLAAQTFDCLAPTSGDHASVNKPNSKDQDCREATLASGSGNMQVSNEQVSTRTRHNSNSSMAHTSNGTSILTSTAANGNVLGLAQVPTSTINGSPPGSTPATGDLTTSQLIRHDLQLECSMCAHQRTCPFVVHSGSLFTLRQLQSTCLDGSSARKMTSRHPTARSLHARVCCLRCTAALSVD
jgi:hypothetical protein